MVPTLVLKYTTYTASKRTKVMKSLRSFIGECRRYEMTWNDMKSKGNSESLKGLLLVWTRLYNIYCIYYTTQTWMVAYGSSVPDFIMARRCSMVRCKLRSMLNFTRNQGISTQLVEGFNMFQLFQPDSFCPFQHVGPYSWIACKRSAAFPGAPPLWPRHLPGPGAKFSFFVHDVCVCVRHKRCAYIYDHIWSYIIYDHICRWSDYVILQCITFI